MNLIEYAERVNRSPEELESFLLRRNVRLFSRNYPLSEYILENLKSEFRISPDGSTDEKLMSSVNAETCGSPAGFEEESGPPACGEDEEALPDDVDNEDISEMSDGEDEIGEPPVYDEDEDALPDDDEDDVAETPDAEDVTGEPQAYDEDEDALPDEDDVAETPDAEDVTGEPSDCGEDKKALPGDDESDVADTPDGEEVMTEPSACGEAKEVLPDGNKDILKALGGREETLKPMVWREESLPAAKNEVVMKEDPDREIFRALFGNWIDELERCIGSGYHIVIDTCSILRRPHAFEMFYRTCEPLLKKHGRKLIVPYVVIVELGKKLCDENADQALKQRAQYAVNLIKSNNSTFEIQGERGEAAEHNNFADSIFTEMVLKWRNQGESVLMITQDFALTKSVMLLRDINCVRSQAEILVYKLDQYGAMVNAEELAIGQQTNA